MFRTVARLMFPPRKSRPFVVALLSLVAALIELYGPFSHRLALAQQPLQAQASQQVDQPAAKMLDLKSIPGDAVGVMAIRPAAVISRLGIGPAAEGIVQGAKEYGLPVDKIEQLTAVLTIERADNQSGSTMPGKALVVRASAPHDWTAYIVGNHKNLQVAEFAGVKYYKPSQPRGPCLFVADDRTLVHTDRETMAHRFILRSQGAPAEHAFKQSWTDLGAVDLAMALDVKSVRPIIAEGLARGNGLAPFGAFAPLWEESQVAVCGVSVQDRLRVQIAATCETPESVARWKNTATGGLTLAGNLLKAQRQQLDKSPEQAALVAPLFALADELLNSANFETNATRVTVSFTTGEGEPSKQNLAVGIKGALAAIDAARQAAQSMQSANNLKQLALAMHNYHDTHRRFPAAAAFGADGKTTHSWRVALLPYLEETTVYQQYRFDETWQSPTNMKLATPMPQVFRHPRATDGTSACYYVLTGPQTIFADNKGISIASVLDGTSNTILIVEAKRDIPWTRPEDIPYEATKPLPELGGFDPTGFFAALADGSVRKFPKNLDEKTLRALITRDGGEVIDFSALDRDR